MISKKKHFITIILILLIVIIFYIYFLYTNNYKNYKNLHGMHNKIINDQLVIAVVGNGEISNKDRIKINKCDIICRFNDTKNLNFFERTDILFVRQNGITNKIFGLINYKPTINCKEIVFVGSWKQHYDMLRKYNNIPIDMIVIYEEHCELPISNCMINSNNKTILFEKKKYNIPYTRSFLSSGFIAIYYLLNKYPNSKLEIFGMNWNGGVWHPMLFEKKLINKNIFCNVNSMNTSIY